MGSSVSRLKEDFVDYPHDHLLLVDMSDILNEMHQTILAYGEHPIYDHLGAQSLPAFLFDIYDEVGFLPKGNRYIAQNISDVLDAAGQYFDHPYMTHLQRQCWAVATQKMVERFMEFKLYDKDHVNQFDFYTYANGTLYLSYNY